jgi:hypothetical protein
LSIIVIPCLKCLPVSGGDEHPVVQSEPAEPSPRV